MVRKSGNRFSGRIMPRRDEVLIRFDRIRTEQMESVAGISRPRRRLFPGGGSKKLAPFGYLPVGNAPLRRKAKGGEVPQPHRPLFSLHREGGCPPCMRVSAAPW